MEESEQKWHCEFCLKENKIMVDEEEVPKNSAVNFIIESAAQIDDKKNEVKNKDISVIFCID